MPKSSAHLRLVSSNDDRAIREAFARKFQETMTDHIRAHTKGTNVNGKTLLATDYLNHFSEAIMLLEMLPAAPAELAADLAQWRHETYEEHFAASGFRDKALAIAGYRYAPRPVRVAFDVITNEISDDLTAVLREAQAFIGASDADALTQLCSTAVPQLQSKIEAAIAIINGEVEPGVEVSTQPCAAAGAHQAAVDSLFD